MCSCFAPMRLGRGLSSPPTWVGPSSSSLRWFSRSRPSPLRPSPPSVNRPGERRPVRRLLPGRPARSPGRAITWPSVTTSASGRRSGHAIWYDDRPQSGQDPYVQKGVLHLTCRSSQITAGVLGRVSDHHRHDPEVAGVPARLLRGAHAVDEGRRAPGPPSGSPPTATRKTRSGRPSTPTARITACRRPLLELRTGRLRGAGPRAAYVLRHAAPEHERLLRRAGQHERARPGRRSGPISRTASTPTECCGRRRRCAGTSTATRCCVRRLSPPPTSRCSSSSTCGSAGPTPRTRRLRTASERRSTG